MPPTARTRPRTRAARSAPYAIGCHPEKDADWYQTARGLVGGDGFVETLPWARKLKALIDGGARIITLRMTRDSIEIVHDRAPDRTRRKL